MGWATALWNGGFAIHTPHPRAYSATTAEAEAWADVLVRHQLLHTAVLASSGQWLVQLRAGSPFLFLDGPEAMVDLTAKIQHLIRTARNHIR